MDYLTKVPKKRNICWLTGGLSPKLKIDCDVTSILLTGTLICFKLRLIRRRSCEVSVRRIHFGRSFRSVARGKVSDNLSNEGLLNERHLRERDVELAFKLRRHVAFTEEAFRSLLPERDLRSALSINAQN